MRESGIFAEACLLHEALILEVEDVVHEVVLEQATHPHTSHEETDISDREREDGERGSTYLADGQS